MTVKKVARIFRLFFAIILQTFQFRSQSFAHILLRAIMGVAVWALTFSCELRIWKPRYPQVTKNLYLSIQSYLTYLSGSDVSLLNPKLSFFKLESSAILQTDKQTDTCIYKLHCYPRLLSSMRYSICIFGRKTFIY